LPPDLASVAMHLILALAGKEGLRSVIKEVSQRGRDGGGKNSPIPTTRCAKFGGKCLNSLVMS